MSDRLVPVADLRPNERFWLYDHRCEVERQCRRTTFARVVRGQLKGARIQIKKGRVVERWKVHR